MQQAEKKKRKSRGPGRILWVMGCAVLLVICVALAIGLNWRKTVEEMPRKTETGGSLENRETEEIARLTVHIRGQEPWTAVRDESGELRLEDAEGWVLDATLSEKIEDALANIVYEDVLTDQPGEYREHLADFGLEDPELIASVTYTDGKTVTLRFGAVSALADRDYCYMLLDGDDRLFAAASSLMEDLKVERELLHPVLQPDIQPALLDRISVRNGEGELQLEWTLQGNPADQDAAEKWMLTAPLRYPADFDTMVNLKKNAGNLRLGVYVGTAEAESLKACGLDCPTRVLELHHAAGSLGRINAEGVYAVESREEKSIRLEIGNARNDMVDYVRYGDEIYTMNHFTLEAILGIDPLETVARYPVPVSLEALRSLTVETAEGKNVYTVTREASERTEEQASPEPLPEEVSGEGTTPLPEENETVLRCEKNGQEISGEVFEAAYQRALVVTVSGRLPEGWEKKETTVRYTFRTLSGAERVLELSEYDALHDAVTLDGCTVFYLIRGGMGEFP